LPRQGARLNDLQQRRLNGVVNPQASEGDAARLSVVELTPAEGIAWDVVLDPGVAHRQFVAAAPAPDEARQQGAPCLGAP